MMGSGTKKIMVENKQEGEGGDEHYSFFHPFFPFGPSSIPAYAFPSIAL